MTDTATLPRPTNRDEDWRYSDGKFLAESAPEAMQTWSEIEVPAGETRCEILATGEGAVERLRVTVGKGARLEAFAILDKDSYRRTEVEVTLHDGAHFEFGGVTIGGGEATQEFVTRTIHAEPNGTSNQTVRAVHWGKATGNFLGRIEVVRDAQKTDAAQNFRAILLEKGATANTKPELEIYADDVQCAHGAAIGQMDEMAGYYMASRGLPPKVARKLLVQAFIGDAFVELADDGLREEMMEQALAKLDEAEL
ncbi:SufD family Fe-S cluster assembly protein [Aurantiacibacter sediminis]|uniref:SufD family Fe-S cluster assembly protein n=1 Tax=Aurantiacibacter sediminis TaxID=2793064 RepID=A0ABS0N0G6_9SPHN|nr:SufD family Fe-S cluster assembly protein [Aurantiacibacter sediminis]MBH5321457.1 SufD family Fe-S cluster assembly protein [Aurantiacibacter sediminis]